MSWWNDFAEQIEHNAPIGPLTWFQLGGKARFLFRPRDTRQLCLFLACAGHEDIPLRILGRGANVLIRDEGFDGAVIRLDQPAFNETHIDGETVSVGAGVSLMTLARDCSMAGFSGLEGLAGIPATVGGAVRMNAGGRFGEFEAVVEQIETVHYDGTLETLSKDRIGFGYRSTKLDDRIVLSAKLRLKSDTPANTKRAFEECFHYKTDTQPMSDHSAGCIFKNPKSAPAGALIDRAGLKGMRKGKASVSTQHANFIVAQRGATATDVLRLIDVVRDRVFETTGTTLETEIDIW